MLTTSKRRTTPTKQLSEVMDLLDLTDKEKNPKRFAVLWSKRCALIRTIEIKKAMEYISNNRMPARAN